MGRNHENEMDTGIVSGCIVGLDQLHMTLYLVGSKGEGVTSLNPKHVADRLTCRSFLLG